MKVTGKSLRSLQSLQPLQSLQSCLSRKQLKNPKHRNKLNLSRKRTLKTDNGGISYEIR